MLLRFLEKLGLSLSVVCLFCFLALLGALPHIAGFESAFVPKGAGRFNKEQQAGRRAKFYQQQALRSFCLFFLLFFKYLRVPVTFCPPTSSDQRQ